MNKRLPTEFAINMNLDRMMILQQSDLKHVGSMNYFNSDSPCHIYFICKRPRITIDNTQFEVTTDYIGFNFKIQNETSFQNLPIQIENSFNSIDIKLITKYPFNTFELLVNGARLFQARVPIFVQSILSYPDDTSFLDLEVLYIGQSYGVDGARTAPDRLVSHSTLQGIYAEAIENNPDCEIWLALASFCQINLTMFDGITQFTKEEKQKDKERYKDVFVKLHLNGINEQQRINFTEAALIRYFEPKYNKIYKETFPNPAHSTYSECYDLDINSVCIEMHTSDMVNCKFFSAVVKKAPWHMKDFLLHSREDRESMFEFFDKKI